MQELLKISLSIGLSATIVADTADRIITRAAVLIDKSYSFICCHIPPNLSVTNDLESQMVDGEPI